MQQTLAQRQHRHCKTQVWSLRLREDEEEDEEEENLLCFGIFSFKTASGRNDGITTVKDLSVNLQQNHNSNVQNFGTTVYYCTNQAMHPGNFYPNTPTNSNLLFSPEDHYHGSAAELSFLFTHWLQQMLCCS